MLTSQNLIYIFCFKCEFNYPEKYSNSTGIQHHCLITIKMNTRVSDWHRSVSYYMWMHLNTWNTFIDVFTICLSRNGGRKKRTVRSKRSKAFCESQSKNVSTILRESLCTLTLEMQTLQCTVSYALPPLLSHSDIIIASIHIWMMNPYFLYEIFKIMNQYEIIWDLKPSI